MQTATPFERVDRIQKPFYSDTDIRLSEGISSQNTLLLLFGEITETIVQFYEPYKGLSKHCSLGSSAIWTLDGFIKWLFTRFVSYMNFINVYRMVVHLIHQPHKLHKGLLHDCSISCLPVWTSERFINSLFNRFIGFMNRGRICNLKKDYLIVNWITYQ